MKSTPAVAVPLAVAQLTETAPDEPPVRSSDRVTLPAFSATFADAAVNRIEPELDGVSLLDTATLAVAGEPSDAPPNGEASETVKVWLLATSVSSRMATWKVLSELSPSAR